MLHIIYLFTPNNSKTSQFIPLKNILSLCRFKTTIVYDTDVSQVNTSLSQANIQNTESFNLIHCAELMNYMDSSQHEKLHFLLMNDLTNFTGTVYRLLSTSKKSQSQYFSDTGTSNDLLKKSSRKIRFCPSTKEIIKITPKDFSLYYRTHQSHSLDHFIGWMSDYKKFEYVNLSSIYKHHGKYIGGGSHASSQVIKIFKKSAQGIDYSKLCDEINYLTHLPETLKLIYPKVCAYSIQDKEANLYLEFVPFPTARDLLFSNQVCETQIYNVITRILTFLWKNYEDTYAPTPQDYIEKYHLNRLYERLKQSINMSPIFREIIQCKKIIINEKEYSNIYTILDKLFQLKHMDEIFKPSYVSKLVHGDLHLENILIHKDSLDYKLVDPRGYKICDVFYDLGKLNHSTNGKYDFIHEYKFHLDFGLNHQVLNAYFSFPDSKDFQAFQNLNDRLQTFYLDNVNDKFIKEKILFNEAMHFCSDMPFQIVGDRVEKRAVAIYLTGIKTFNLLLDLIEKETSYEK